MKQELARITTEIADLEMRLEDLQLFGGTPAALEEERRKLADARERRARVEENLRRVDTTPSGSLPAVQAARWEPLALHPATFARRADEEEAAPEAEPEPDADADESATAPLERTIAEHLAEHGTAGRGRIRQWTRQAGDDVRLLRICAALQSVFGRSREADKVRRRILLLDPDVRGPAPAQREPLAAVAPRNGELADVRDGLVHAQRAVLSSLWNLGAWSDRPGVPFSRLVQCTGLDLETVSEAAWQLGANCTRSPLIDDAHSAARLTALGEHAFWPLTRGEVFDAPVLSGNVPCLLLIGSWGRARSHCLPWNLRELVTAAHVSSVEPAHFAAGPDLPTGGVASSSYEDRRQVTTAWPRRSIERDSSSTRARLLYSEFPLPMRPEQAKARVEELRAGGALEGVSTIDVLPGERLCIEVEHVAFSYDVAFRLHLALRCTYECSHAALVDGAERDLSVRDVIRHWVERIRSVFIEQRDADIRRDAERAHLLEGFLVAQRFEAAVTAVLRATDASEDARDAEWALTHLWSPELATRPEFARLPHIDSSAARAFVDELAQRLASATPERPWKPTHDWLRGFSPAQAAAVKSARQWRGRSTTLDELVQIARNTSQRYTEFDEGHALVTAHLDHLARAFGVPRRTRVGAFLP